MTKKTFCQSKEKFKKITLPLLNSKSTVDDYEQGGSYHRKMGIIDEVVDGRGLIRVKTYEEPEVTAKREFAGRGKVRGFSRKSRKRMADMVQTLNFEKLTQGNKVKPYFLTLTYGQQTPNEATAKRHLTNLFKRFERRYPKFCCLWRLEYQKRGAVHFHVLIFGVPCLLKKKLEKMWFQIVSDGYKDFRFTNNASGTAQCPFLDIKEIRHERGCAWYVAKYCAKSDYTKDASFDDRKVSNSPNRTVGLDRVPYLTANSLKANNKLITKILQRAYSAGDSAMLPPDIYTKRGYESEFKEFMHNALGHAIHKYALHYEMDILCPVTGRIWGTRKKSEFDGSYSDLLKIFHSDDLLRNLKTFMRAIRTDKAKICSDDDRGFTFYVNSEHERSLFYEIMNDSYVPF